MGSFRFRCDPCGILCILFVYTIVLYSDYAFVRWILFPLKNRIISALNGIIYQMVVVLLVWSHAMACFSDPGIIQPNLSVKQSLLKEWTVCSKCGTHRPPRAHHCRICERCIRKMDHHCPWINNCVGEFNQKYFVQFLFYVSVMSLYTVIVIGATYTSIERPSHSKVIHTIILLIFGLLFGIFVAAVLTDQLQGIFTDETMIEKCQHQRGFPTKPKSILLKELFGSGSMLLWLLPCQISSKGYKSLDMIV